MTIQTTEQNGKIFTLLDAYDLSGGDTTTSEIGSAGIKAGTVQIAQSGVTGTTKTIAVQFQGSVDGEEWFDVTGATVTTADAAADVKHIDISTIRYPYIRCSADAHADITAGSLSIKMWGEFK